MQTIKDSTATERIEAAHAEPATMLKQIGSTTYVVSVHFSRTSHETIEDKILRLIQREVNHIA